MYDEDNGSFVPSNKPGEKGKKTHSMNSPDIFHTFEMIITLLSALSLLVGWLAWLLVLVLTLGKPGQ